MQRALFQQGRSSQGFFRIYGSAFTTFSHWGYFSIPITLLLGVAVVIADDTRSSAGTVNVNSSVTGTISEAGDVDYWRIDVPSDGQLVIETTGTTDTKGELEDSAGNKIDEHDDQDVDTNRNFKIERSVTAGTYYIRVFAYRNLTGDYTLHVRHVPADDGSGDSEGEDESEGDDEETQAGDVHLIPSLGDLNGDGRDDVLLRHTDGTWQYYPMNGREFLADQRGAAFLTSNLEWQFAGIGDLNGDGKDDVLVRRVTNGRWYYYPMDGRRHLIDQRGGMSLISDLAWEFAGIGDLNGDGNDDVLLRHRDDGRWLYYPMDGRTHITGGRGLANIPRDLAWQLAGIGDLNGDGNDDVLLRHTDGTWQYFPMNGRDYLRDQRGAAFLTGNLEWQFAGIGDLNGDGKDDVLLRHVMTGRWYYYPMDGRRHITAGDGGANIVSDLAWQMAGIGDLNGDGKDDVLLRHRDDGRWLYYPMDGREFIAGQRSTASITRDLDWSIAGAGALSSPPPPIPPETSMPIELVASYSNLRVAFSQETPSDVYFSLDINAFDSESREPALINSLRTPSTNYNNGIQEFYALQSISCAGSASRFSYNALLLFDRSGSMSSNDPQGLTLDAGKEFARRIDSLGHGLIAQFSASLPNQVEFITPDFTNNSTQLIADIDSISAPIGGTPLWNAMNESIDRLNQSRGSVDKSALITFSDGEDTSSTDSDSSVLRRALGDQILVYSVNLRNSDSHDLDNIALRTGGSVYSTDDASRLLAFYGTLGNLLSGNTSTCMTQINARVEAQDGRALGYGPGGSLQIDLEFSGNTDSGEGTALVENISMPFRIGERQGATSTGVPVFSSDFGENATVDGCISGNPLRNSCGSSIYVSTCSESLRECRSQVVDSGMQLNNPFVGEDDGPRSSVACYWDTHNDQTFIPAQLSGTAPDYVFETFEQVGEYGGYLCVYSKRFGN